MTSEEFWRDDPKLFSSYQKAYVEKIKKRNEEINRSNWLQGLYIYDGLKKTFNDFGYNFWGKQNPHHETYPVEPYDLYGKKEKNDMREREKIKKQNQNNLIYWASIKK